MARVVVVRVKGDRVVVSLSLPPGFDVDKIDGTTLRANDHLAADEWDLQPRRAQAADLFRGFHVSFPRPEVEAVIVGDPDGVLRVSGSLGSGARFSGWCAPPPELWQAAPTAPHRSGSTEPRSDRGEPASDRVRRNPADPGNPANPGNPGKIDAPERRNIE